MTAWEKADGEPVILLLRWGKINEFRGIRSITNAFGECSQVIINPDIKEAEPLMTRCTLVDNAHLGEFNTIGRDDYWNQFQKCTIYELMSSTEVGKWKVSATILANDLDWCWYYFTCKKCKKTALKNPKEEDCKEQKTTFWCEQCSMETPNVLPRFKMHVEVFDDTGNAKFLLWDTPAQTIVGKSASEILNGNYEEMKDPSIIPQCLKECVGRTYIFLAEVKMDNIKGGNDIYKVSKIFDQQQMVKIQDSELHSEQQSENSEFDTMDQRAGGNGWSEVHDNGTPLLSSTPSSKRVSDDFHDDENGENSTTKKSCLERIGVTGNLESKFDD